MAEPVYSDACERIWARLPEYLRNADSPAFVFKTWMSGVADELGTITTLLDRIDYTSIEDGGAVGDTSDLVDPNTADPAWLPWLAQAVGVTLGPTLTVAEQRAAIAGVSTGFMAGTKTAVAQAAQTELTGTKYVKIYDHSTSSSALGGATIWDVLVVTRTSETPNTAAVLDAIVRKGAKPAGVTLWWKSFDTSWTQLEQAYPTWNDWEAANPWDHLQETGLT